MICRCAEASGVSIGEQCAREWEAEIRKAYPAERVHIPPPGSRKDPARAEAIRKAAARLPTRVVAERLGISRQHVYRVVKRKP
jgi:DNA-binding transcriptional regulator LsrR (DeoR family)